MSATPMVVREVFGARSEELKSSARP